MYNHFEYSENLARCLASIRHTDDECHFLRSDEVEEISDLEERISSIRGFILVAIDGLESNFLWQVNDNLTEVPQFFIAVLKKCNSGDINAIHKAKKECKVILMQIIAKMMLEYEDLSGEMNFLDPESFSIQGVSIEDFKGLMLGFNLKRPTPFIIDKSMWL